MSLKIIRYGFFLFLIISSCSFTNVDNKTNSHELDKIKMYFSRWGANYNIPRTNKNIKELYELYSEIIPDDFSLMFDSYEDMSMKLSNKRLQNQTIKKTDILVEFYFGDKKHSVFFLANGNYNFEGIWYKNSLNFSYYLFRGFSSELFHIEMFNTSDKELKSRFFRE